MKKLLILIASLGMASICWLTIPGLASSLSDTTRTLGGRNIAVPQCDVDGFTTILNVTSGNVTGVTVSGIASACGGSTLNMRVASGATTQSGSIAIPGGGGSVTVTLGTSIALTDSMATDFFI